LLILNDLPAGRIVAIEPEAELENVEVEGYADGRRLPVGS
jgi:hypothetical protein